MRIISGTLKGRRIELKEDLPVRPTTDMARESLFNILNNYIDYMDVSVMDLFAGTGAVSLEFVSRGAKEVTAVEINSKCVDFIRKNAEKFGTTNLHVVRADVFDFLKRAYKKFDIVFADPPYSSPDLPKLPDIVFEKDILTDNGILILEHPKEHSFESHPHFWQHRKYGKVNFTFFAKTITSTE